MAYFSCSVVFGAFRWKMGSAYNCAYRRFASLLFIGDDS
jgi:hypothetical protein